MLAQRNTTWHFQTLEQSLHVTRLARIVESYSIDNALPERPHKQGFSIPGKCHLPCVWEGVCNQIYTETLRDDQLSNQTSRRFVVCSGCDGGGGYECRQSKQEKLFVHVTFLIRRK